MKKTIISTCVLFSMVLLLSNAFAEEVCSQRTVYQWGGPETRTRCIGYASGSWPWGGGWKTCNQWATDLQQHAVNVIVKCPSSNMPTAIRQIVDGCIGTAMATAVGSVVYQPATALDLLRGRLTALDESFKACINTANAAISWGGYYIDVQRSNFW